MRKFNFKELEDECGVWSLLLLPAQGCRTSLSIACMQTSAPLRPSSSLVRFPVMPAASWGVRKKCHVLDGTGSFKWMKVSNLVLLYIWTYILLFLELPGECLVGSQHGAEILRVRLRVL